MPNSEEGLNVKIAVVHSQYRGHSPSGENLVVAQQVEALERAGHEVRLLVKRSDEEEKAPFYGLRAALNVSFGFGNSLLKETVEFKPDVVHVHNLFPNLGWSWLDKIGAPSVVTLHNYRAFCAKGTAMLHGEPCVRCPTKGSIHGVINSCYRDSRLATIPLAIQTRGPITSHHLVALANGLVFLSTEMKVVFESLGLHRKLTDVIPNFVPSNSNLAEKKNGKWIWVGRLTEEKGLANLLKVWPDGEQLEVFGSGPLESDLQKLARTGIVFRGLTSPQEIREEMPGYQGMIVSSEMPGNSIGLVHLEALAAGLPVIALKGSSSAAEVEATGHGSTYVGEEDLLEALKLWGATHDVREEIVDRFETMYSEKIWVEKTLDFYERVLETWR